MTDQAKTTRPTAARRLIERLTHLVPAWALPFVTRSLRGKRASRVLGGSVLLAACTALIGLWLALGSGHLEQGLRQSMGLEPYDWDRAAQDYTVYTRSKADADALQANVNGELPDAAWHEYGSDFWRDADQYRALQQDPISTILAMANTDDARLDRAQRAQQRRARDFIESHADRFSAEALEVIPALQVAPPPPSDDALTKYAEVDPAQMAEAGVDPSSFDPREYRDDSVWDGSDMIARAETAMDHELMPRVEAYRSPLGLRQAVGLIGLVAGGLWTILWLVVAPVAVGAQQAQERHENTLMPLTATSLSARELVLGLASGPAVAIAALGLPQLLIALVCAALLGFALPMVLMGAMLTVLMAVPTTLAGQLLGQIAGRRHAPGLVTFGLLAVFAPLWFVGLSLANTCGISNMDADLARLLAMVPTAGALTWIERAFVAAAYDTEIAGQVWSAADPAAFGVAVRATVVATLAAAGLGALLLRTLERHVPGSDGASLSRAESWFGAALAMGLIGWTIPFDDLTASGGMQPSEYYLASLGLLAPALGLLVMARVPLLSAPGTREIQLRTMFADVSLWCGIHLLGVTMLGLITDGELIGAWNPVTLAYLAWVVVTLTLLGTRVVAFPLGVGGAAWAMLTATMGIVAYVHIIAFGDHGGPGFAHPFGLAELSPALGLLQAAMLVVVPAVLWRRLAQRTKLV